MSQVDEGSTRQRERESPAIEVIGNSQAQDEAGSFVERETRRRKRLLRLYLMLLIIPVALAIVILIYGRSDRRAVMDEIKAQAPPIVQREVGQQIKPTIETEVQKQISQPLEQIDSKINEVAQTKVSQEEINKIQGENAALRNQLSVKIDEVDKAKASREEVTKTVQEGNESIRKEVNSRFVQTGISREEFNRLQEENKSLRIELNDLKTGLERRFQALQQRVLVLSNQKRIPQ
jgi:chaperonin cofactor prefoldin